MFWKTIQIFEQKLIVDATYAHLNGFQHRSDYLMVKDALFVAIQKSARQQSNFVKNYLNYLNT